MKAEEVEAAFRQIMVQSQNSEKEKRGEEAVSIDGKAQRGRWKFEEKKGYPVHAVSLVAHQTGIVLSQGHVRARQFCTITQKRGDMVEDCDRICTGVRREKYPCI